MRHIVVRIAVTIGVAAAVVAVAAGGSLVLEPTSPSTEIDYPEYGDETLVSEPLPARGEVRPDAVSFGTVVIDVSNTTRTEPEDVAPLVRAFERVGYDVSYHRGGDLGAALDDADAAVVADPRTPYGPGEVSALESFVDDGGRLLILGEPNRAGVVDGRLGAGTVRSETAELEAAFDVHFDSRYVYDLRDNDGNYKHVVAEPTDRAGMGGIDEVVLYAPVEVTSTGTGVPVLVTGENARTARSDEQRAHTLAVVDGNVMAIGDASLLSEDRYNVGDNEEFLARVVEFLVGESNGTSVIDG